MIETDAGVRKQPRRVRPIHVAFALIVAVMLGLGAGAALHSLLRRSAPVSTATQSSGLHGQATWAAGAAAAPAIKGLRDQTGRTFSLTSLRGHTVALTFFDSHCNQACPLEGRALAVAERQSPAAARPVFVAVSINPRDTRASARAAANKWGLAEVSSWHWLMGTHAQLAAVWKAYHIFVASPVHGDIVHTAALYLIDRSGYERSGYLYPFETRFVASDLRTLSRAGAG